MDKPFWFSVVEQWKTMEKGEYGVTFPFLIGAISKVSGRSPDRNHIEEMFQEIIEAPLDGHYCEVRWCGNIEEPVASVKQVTDINKVSIKSFFKSPNGTQVSLAFTTDLMSMFNLNCTTEKDCLEKLITYTTENASKGNFSKHGGQFTPFSSEDLEFINLVSSQ